MKKIKNNFQNYFGRDVMDDFIEYLKLNCKMYARWREREAIRPFGFYTSRYIRRVRAQALEISTVFINRYADIDNNLVLQESDKWLYPWYAMFSDIQLLVRVKEGFWLEHDLGLATDDCMFDFWTDINEKLKLDLVIKKYKHKKPKTKRIVKNEMIKGINSIIKDKKYLLMYNEIKELKKRFNKKKLKFIDCIIPWRKFLIKKWMEDL